jgi:hypothetical protein
MNGIAPWLQPADPTKDFIQAYQASSQIALARQRAAQQAQQYQQDFAQQQQAMEVRHQQQDKEAAMEQQRLEIAKSYHEQQMALGQQKLQEAQQMNQMEIQQAAQRSAAMMEASQRIASGENPMTVWSDVGPRAGLGGAALAAMGKTQNAQAYVPEEYTSPSGQAYHRGSPAGTWEPSKPEPAPKPSAMENSAANVLMREIDKEQELVDSTKGMDKDIKETKLSRIDSMKEKVNAMRISQGLDPLYDDMRPPPVPAKDKLVKGKKYRIKQGVAVWNGTHFVAE